MIATIDQVASGGALQLVLQPLQGATSMRITRGATPSQLVDETSGTIVYEGAGLAYLDGPLVNGQSYAYRAFYLVAGSWVGTPAVTQTPVATFADYSADPMGLLRDRLSAGFAELVARTAANSALPGPQLNPASGVIPVLFGTPEYDKVTFPLVTLHLASEEGSRRALGEVVHYDDAGEEYEGWLADVQITVSCWSDNYDEREAMRRALRAIVIANFPIFEAAGITLPRLGLQESDDMTSYPVPMYQVVGTFSCVAPVVVGQARPVVVDVAINVNGGS